ncbi:ATPase (plasmid) [Pararobbsia alpina]|uniref:AAA family ATPase n=1 Tax=Pararobbsia alpina TaxID=621374 RepID=UPI0039A41EAE
MLEVKSIKVENYRSLRDVEISAQTINIFTGPNGAGKSTLYNCLSLVQAAAAGDLSTVLAREGGMQSAISSTGRAHPRGPLRITLTVRIGVQRTDDVLYEYVVSLGLVEQRFEGGEKIVSGPAFEFEPQIKEESLSVFDKGRRWSVLHRRNSHVKAMDESTTQVDLSRALNLQASETALSRIDEPSRYPDIYVVRRFMLDWRFYHEIRTDFKSPLRSPCLAVTSLTLNSDGSNLPAVLASAKHIVGDTSDIDEVIATAFAGAELVVPRPAREASFGLNYPDISNRIFNQWELSDGTLKFLGLVGALLAPRLPAFIALNEPENSLHPSLYEPLAKLIERASRRTQIWLVTHADEFAYSVCERSNDTIPAVGSAAT